VPSDDMPPELARPDNEQGLDSYVKLAIAYLGIGVFLNIFTIMSGLNASIASLGAQGVGTGTAFGYAIPLGWMALMGVTMYILSKGKRIGGYLFFITVCLWELQYISNLNYLLFTLIPSGVVSGLLLKSFKHLK